MKLLEALALPILESTRVVAGRTGLERDVLWVHIVDLPDPLPWVRPGQLLLTTGYAWPRDEEAQRMLVRSLAERNLAGLGMAVPHFFEHFSQAAHEEADQVALPLLELPWDVPFVQITEALHRAILAEQYQVIEQSEIIHRALTRAALEAGSLQEIAATLGRLIKRAITFEDMDGRVLAEYSIEHEEDGARRATRAGGRSPLELLASLESLGYLRAIRAASKPIHLPALPQLDFVARVVCPIRLKEELVGQVWIIEGEEALGALELRAAEHAAVVAALQIAHQRELTLLEARLGYTFLDTLLEGRFEPTPHALERAKLLGFDPQGDYRVGLLVLDEPVPLSRAGLLRRDRLADMLRRRLQTLGVAPLLSLSLNQISFLLPRRCAGEALWSVLAEEGASLAFGREQRGIAGVQRSYQEALSLLAYLPPRSFHYYEALLLPRVLLGDQEAHQAFLETLLGRLKLQRNGDTLLETLLAWARAGFHGAVAAQQLNIHPKTLQYRLARAAEAARLDLADADVRFKLQLAAHLKFLSAQRG
ncbi:MAG TPA: PucR family transcriptional regulator ligand-binding domain-containing protein [Ktedonobacterales bacterium]|nr:PucR family transcriptional regulator ligand-binding domain-containing protein [Ktedonobacterales bacterium]